MRGTTAEGDNPHNLSGKRTVAGVSALESWTMNINHWDEFIVHAEGVSGPKNSQFW